MYDVFISYSREDEKWVTQLAKRLRRRRHPIRKESLKVFLDLDSIGVGENWLVKLENALETSQYIIPIYSPSYFQSRASGWELLQKLIIDFDGRDRIILPCLLRKCNIPPRFRHIHYLDFSNAQNFSSETFGSTFEKLVNAIKGGITDTNDHKSGKIEMPTTISPVISLSQAVPTFLISQNIPCEIIEEGKNHVDVIIIDPSSVLPTKYYLSASNNAIDEEFLDTLLKRTKSHNRISHTIAITTGSITDSIKSYAEHREINILHIDEFRREFLRKSASENYIIGALASQKLAEGLNIDEVYVPPDAVSSYPGELMESKFLSQRICVLEVINGFLANSNEKILFVFGGYGSGKSALCAYLCKTLSTQEQDFTPVYIPLKQVESAKHLTMVTDNANQLAKTVSNEQKNILLILDGIDELPNAMDVNEKRLNMLRLLKSTQKTDKIIVTVRTSYFRGLADFWNLFARDDDNPLWNDMGGLITSRPKIAAVILREFDKHQIEQFVRKFGEVKGKRHDFVEKFFFGMNSNDPKSVYRMLSRNPLYLYLLVNNEPWKHKGVSCFGDVLQVFIRSWLERDVAKGQSRWLLRIDDRVAFMAAIAWEMFENDKISITFDEFDQFVLDFYGASIRAKEVSSISLDLQTTGIFSCIGQSLYFSLPAYMDYFVALKFHTGHLAPKLPTSSQARIWLGLAEIYRKNPYENLTDRQKEDWLKVLGVEIDENLSKKLDVEPTGIIYKKISKTWSWPFLNKKQNTLLRAIISKALTPTEMGDEKAIQVLVANINGLHMRAAAKLVEAYARWEREFEKDKKPLVVLRYEGKTAIPGSLLTIVSLAIPYNQVFEIVYRNCETKEIENLLRAMDGVPDSDRIGFWVTDFGIKYEEAYI